MLMNALKNLVVILVLVNENTSGKKSNNKIIALNRLKKMNRKDWYKPSQEFVSQKRVCEWKILIFVKETMTHKA